MKRICTLAFVAALLMGCAVAAFAEKLEIPESVTMSPKQFAGYTAKKGDVEFNHASHMQIACADCHHTVTDSYTFQGCMSEGCHDNIAIKPEPSSVYRTFHSTKDTTKSCVGCHRKVKRDGAGDAPIACKSCHTK